MAAYNWQPRKRPYAKQRQKLVLAGESVISHPLANIIVTDIKKTKDDTSRLIVSDFVDPLSAALQNIDPLQSASSSRKKSESYSSIKHSEDKLDETFEPWYLKKPNILSKYTTSEKLSITTHFISNENKEKVMVKMQTTVTDKVKNRLEQLDDFDESSISEMLDLTQQDYMKRIDQLNQSLIEAWERDQRVKALKISIQCAKLLADTSVIQFYPSKFVLITDILDTLGKLVYTRLRDKGQYFIPGSNKPIRLSDSFTPDEVPESAKETCKNWFFKIASIRELVPRFYVETAILQSYRFLDPQEIVSALKRLSEMIHGIGDPLVAIYAQCYLCRVGMNTIPSFKDYIHSGFNYFLDTYSQLNSDCVQNVLALQKVDISKYVSLYSPALEWILQCLAYRATEDTLGLVLEKCRNQCKSSLLVNSIMSAFQPDYIAKNALLLTDIIKDCDDTGLPKHCLHRTLGLCLLMADPDENQRLHVLNEVWKTIMKLGQPEDYISCAEVWIEYVAKHFGKRELNTILGDIIKHMLPDRAFESNYPQLQSIVSKLLVYIQDFSLLFVMEKFLTFLDLFQKESVKVEVCKQVLEAFNKYQTEQTNDPVIIYAVMYLCKALHDSINALTVEDESRQVGALICNAINKISFGRDFEQQLSFYVEARSQMGNLDSVLTQLVHSVNRLAIKTRVIMKGVHSRKTSAFVRACAAYSFITIPSLDDHMSRLHLYLSSSQVAIQNLCLSQADAFIKAAISLLADTPTVTVHEGKTKSVEFQLIDFIYNLLATLLVIPDNPEFGVLYLTRGLLNVIQTIEWDPNLDSKVHIYTKCLCLLSAMSQESFLYKIDKLDSNDMLYGQDEKFLKEVNDLGTTVLNEILGHLRSLSTLELQKTQSSLSLELFSVLVGHSDLSQQNLFNLATNLWALINKNGVANVKQMTQVYVHIKQLSNAENIYSNLLKEINLTSK